MLSVIMPVGGQITTCPYRKRAFEWLSARYEALLPDAQMCYGESRQEIIYNRSEARNNAFKEAEGDILLVADADTIFNVDQIEAGLRAIENGAPWVIPYRSGPQQGQVAADNPEGGYYNLSEDASTMLLDLLPPNAYFMEPTDPTTWEFKLNSVAGLLMLPRVSWEIVGGYDENFMGWGYEDDAFRAALDHLTGRHQRVEGFVAHLWHPAPETERFGQPYTEQNRTRYMQYEKGYLP